MAKCIYIAVEPSVAGDIADGLNKSADLIEQLVEALVEIEHAESVGIAHRVASSALSAARGGSNG